MTSQNLFAPPAVRSAAAALLVAGVLALAGCAGGAPADPGSSSQPATEAATPSASPTPTPTPSAVYKPADASGPAQNVPVPVLPEVAKTETKEGAEAFTKYWYETLSYAYETGSSKNLENISGPNCVFCKGLKDGIDEAWSEGRWISGGTIQTPVITATVEPGAQPHAEVQVIQATIEIRRPDGSLLQDPTPATNTGSRAGLTFGPSGWVMTDLGLIR